MKTLVPPAGLADLTRIAARLVVCAWAAFWVWFNVLAGWSELSTHGFPSAGGHAIFALVLLAAVGVCWRHELFGAVLLLAIAGAGFWLFQNPRWLGSQWMVPVLLLAPPLLAACLLLISANIRRLH